MNPLLDQEKRSERFADEQPRVVPMNPLLDQEKRYLTPEYARGYLVPMNPLLDQEKRYCCVVVADELLPFQ